MASFLVSIPFELFRFSTISLAKLLLFSLPIFSIIGPIYVIVGRDGAAFFLVLVVSSLPQFFLLFILLFFNSTIFYGEDLYDVRSFCVD